jgi:hypothetical protein
MKLEICIRNAWSNRVHRWAKFRIKKQEKKKKKKKNILTL